MSIPVESAMIEYLYKKATDAQSPLSGTFELTPLCNMNCKMCYVRLSEKEQKATAPIKTAGEWLNIAREAKNAGMLFLLLTGGEPFLHPEIRTIIENLHKMGFILSINSNGTLIDEATVQWLKDCPPARVNITLYGASDEAYLRLCRKPDGFTLTDNAIQLLRSNGISVRINCSITPHNASDLPAIAEYAKKNNLPFQPAAYMFPPTRKDISMTGTNDRFTPEAAAYYTAYSDYLINGRESFLSRSFDMPPEPETDDACSPAGDRLRCRAGRCSFWITWNGNMLPCGMFPREYSASLSQSDFEGSWQQIKNIVSAIRLPSECSSCKLKKECRACAAMVITESGCFDKAPAYRCAMMNALPKERIKLQNILRSEINEN